MTISTCGPGRVLGAPCGECLEMADSIRGEGRPDIGAALGLEETELRELEETPWPDWWRVRGAA